MREESEGPQSVEYRTGTLLLLDGDVKKCRMMGCFLSPYFGKVFISADPIMANRIIEGEPVTHLIADLELEGTADGIDFLTLWRREFRSIERAVLIAAYDIELPEEVDAVVSREDNIDVVIDALLG